MTARLPPPKKAVPNAKPTEQAQPPTKNEKEVPETFLKDLGEEDVFLLPMSKDSAKEFPLEAACEGNMMWTEEWYKDFQCEKCSSIQEFSSSPEQFLRCVISTLPDINQAKEGVDYPLFDEYPLAMDGVWYMNQTKCC